MPSVAEGREGALCSPALLVPVSPRGGRGAPGVRRGRKRKRGRGDHGAAGAGKEPPPAPGERPGGSGTGERSGDGMSRAQPERCGLHRHREWLFAG